MLVLSLSLAVSVQDEDSRSHGRWMVRCWSCVHLASAPLRWLPLVTWSPLPVLPPAWPRPDVTTTISPSSFTATESQLCSERLQAGKCCVVTLQLLHSQPPPPPLTLALILLMSLLSRTWTKFRGFLYNLRHQQCPFALFSLQPHLLPLFSQSSHKTISKVGSCYIFRIHCRSHFRHWYFQYFHFVSESLLG